MTQIVLMMKRQSLRSALSPHTRPLYSPNSPDPLPDVIPTPLNLWQPIGIGVYPVQAELLGHYDGLQTRRQCREP